MAAHHRRPTSAIPAPSNGSSLSKREASGAAVLGCESGKPDRRCTYAAATCVARPSRAVSPATRDRRSTRTRSRADPPRAKAQARHVNRPINPQQISIANRPSDPTDLSDAQGIGGPLCRGGHPATSFLCLCGEGPARSSGAFVRLRRTTNYEPQTTD